jgi:hypothetical protein
LTVSNREEEGKKEYEKDMKYFFLIELWGSLIYW